MRTLNTRTTDDNINIKLNFNINININFSAYIRTIIPNRNLDKFVGKKSHLFLQLFVNLIDKLKYLNCCEKTYKIIFIDFPFF